MDKKTEVSLNKTSLVLPSLLISCWQHRDRDTGAFEFNLTGNSDRKRLREFQRGNKGIESFLAKQFPQH